MDGGKLQLGPLRYGHIEAALVEVLGIKPSARPAFRARIRHLRNLGLPELRAPGRGFHLEYTRRQALAMLAALQLENVGQAASDAVDIAESMVRQAPYGQHNGLDCYVYVGVIEKGRQYTMAFGLEGVVKMMKRAPEVLLLLNLSACVRRLDPALDRALVAR